MILYIKFIRDYCGDSETKTEFDYRRAVEAYGTPSWSYGWYSSEDHLCELCMWNSA